MDEVYIITGARSYIGVEQGMYRHVPAEQLGAFVVGKVIEKMGEGFCVEDIDLVIAGNGVGAGGNIARLMTLTAKLPESIPAFSVDLQCGSGLESIAIGAAKIKSGQAQVVLAGGFESSSTAPRRGYHRNHPDFEKYEKIYKDGWYPVAKFAPGEHREKTMLEGAEKTALWYEITREQLNPWVLGSHAAAIKAEQEGILDDVLVEVLKGCNKDEGIRHQMSEKLLNRLPLILPKGQVLTAANTCLTNDGAAFVMLASQEYVNSHHLKPMGKFLDVVEVGGDPSMSPQTAILAVEKMLHKHHLSPEQIDIYECNEAFAVIDELFCRRFGKELMNRYNIYGGALAYGHPYGASGGIITLHGLTALKNTGGTYGIFSVAAAGGVGTAILVENIWF